VRTNTGVRSHRLGRSYPTTAADASYVRRPTMIALVLGLRAYLGADRSRARARAGVRASSGERGARIVIADVAPADQARQLVEDEGAEALVVPFRLLNGTEARWGWVPGGTAARRVAVVLPGGVALAALPTLLAGEVRSVVRLRDVRPTRGECWEHPAWQPDQAWIAAVGGADRRAAKNAAAPLNQSREAHQPARLLHSPEGGMTSGNPRSGRRRVRTPRAYPLP
jgi:hypothetical protein